MPKSRLHVAFEAWEIPGGPKWLDHKGTVPRAWHTYKQPSTPHQLSQHMFGCRNSPFRLQCGFLGLAKGRFFLSFCPLKVWGSFAHHFPGPAPVTSCPAESLRASPRNWSSIPAVPYSLFFSWSPVLWIQLVIFVVQRV